MVIHESKVQAVSLPGRDHKMIIGPGRAGDARHMCFGVADFPPRSHAPEHVHEIEEEIIYVLSGHGAIYFDSEPEAIEAGSCIYIRPKTVHSIKNDSANVMKLVYVFSPPVTQGSYDKNSKK
ncbi:MAG: cupin domain-containing protein [Bacillota bacterium]|nr:cupin domain-containing protein [Bacillota bacterium]